MLNEGWQSHLRVLVQGADARRSAPELFNDLPPRGVGQCMEHLVGFW